MPLPTSDQQGIDSLKFRQTLGHYPTGVVVVTAITPAGKPMGMVVGTFTSVSLDPPLVAFLPTRASETFEQLRTASSFCINVLADDQEPLARKLARRDENKFDDVAWTPALSGAPIIDGVVAAIDCTFDSVLDAGDHYIVLAAVQDLQIVNPVAPLLFFQGGYGSFTPMSLVAGDDAQLISGVRLAELARHEMEEVAERLHAECIAYVTVGDDVALVASAVTPGVPMLAQLGTRFPLMPPLGELFVAWESDDAVERWLSSVRASGDEEQLEGYRSRLSEVRERGWTMTLAGAPNDARLYDALRDYSTRKVTPARLTEIKADIRNAARRHGPTDIDDAEEFDIVSLLVPVRNADGRVVLVLRATQLHAANGREIRRWASDLQETAARIELAISAEPETAAH